MNQPRPLFQHLRSCVMTWTGILPVFQSRTMCHSGQVTSSSFHRKKGGRGRGRERERETDRQTDRQTDSDPVERETETETDRQTERDLSLIHI